MASSSWNSSHLYGPIACIFLHADPKVFNTKEETYSQVHTNFGPHSVLPDRSILSSPKEGRWKFHTCHAGGSHLHTPNTEQPLSGRWNYKFIIQHYFNFPLHLRLCSPALLQWLRAQAARGKLAGCISIAHYSRPMRTLHQATLQQDDPATTSISSWAPPTLATEQFICSSTLDAWSIPQ